MVEDVVEEEMSLDDRIDINYIEYLVSDLFEHSMKLFEVPAYRLELVMQYHGKDLNDLVTLNQVNSMIESYLNHSPGG